MSNRHSMTGMAINGLSRPSQPSQQHPASQLVIKLLNRTITSETTTSSLKDTVSYISSSSHHLHRNSHLSASLSSYHPPPIKHTFLPSSSLPPLLPQPLSSNSTSFSVPSLSNHFHSQQHHNHLHHHLSNFTTTITNTTANSTESSISEAESSIAASINATIGSGTLGSSFSSWFSWWRSSIYTHPDILLAFALIVFYAIFVLFICAIILRIAITIMCSSSGRTLAATFATSSEGFSETESSSQRTRGYSQSYSASYTNNKNRRFFAHEMTSFAIGDRTNSPSIIDEEDEES